jgi:cytochrome bd-type quinol oxidase subunit 2
MNHEKVLNVATGMGRLMFKFSVWVLLSGATFYFVCGLVSIALTTNAAVHPEQNVMAQIFCFAVAVTFVIFYVFLTDRIWRSDRLIIRW